MKESLRIPSNVLGEGEQVVRMSDNTLNTEQKLLWLTWREKNRRLDRLTEKRMKLLFLTVGLILLGWILYYALWAKASFDPNQQPAAIMSTAQLHSSGCTATISSVIEYANRDQTNGSEPCDSCDLDVLVQLFPDCLECS